VRWALDVLILSMGGFIAALVVSGGWQFSIMGRPLPIHSLYTPMMVLTMLVAIRVAWELRTSLLRRAIVAVHSLLSRGRRRATFLLSPVLYATAIRIRTWGEFDPAKIFWRSSPGGVDVLALFLPNPNHPFAPAAVVDWLNSLPTKYIEGLVSGAARRHRHAVRRLARRMDPSRWWTGLTVLFGLLALGPFIHIAGVNTYVPGPVGISALRADSRSHAIAIAIQCRAHARHRDSVCDGAGRAHTTVSASAGSSSPRWARSCSSSCCLRRDRSTQRRFLASIST
jgi:hypothetical protein